MRAPLPARWVGVLTLAVEPFYAALPASHRLATRPQIRLADLASEAFALFPRDVNPPAHDDLMSSFAAAGYLPRIGQSSRRMDESLVFVASGSGVGLFPLSVTETVTEPDIVFRPLADPTPTVEMVLAWDVDSLNPLVPALVHAAEEHVGTMP